MTDRRADAPKEPQGKAVVPGGCRDLLERWIDMYGGSTCDDPAEQKDMDKLDFDTRAWLSFGPYPAELAVSEIGPTVATDTPRTDKFYDDVSDREHHDDGTDPNWHLPSKWSYEAILDLVDFARTLEREAAALREKCRLEWDLRIVAERQRDEAAARERNAILRMCTAEYFPEPWLANRFAAAIRARSGEGRNGG